MEQNKETIETLAMGTTTEEMKAQYFDSATLHEPEYRLYQLNTRGKRYYYMFDEEGNPTFFPSVTTILKNVMPENTILTDWKLSLGKEESLAYSLERAAYGTFIHSQLAELMIARCYSLDEVHERLAKYAERENYPLSFVEDHEEEAKADMLAFAKWMRDYDVKPYAVEVSIYSPTMKIAGMIDLVCNMRERPIPDEQKEMDKLQEKLEKAKGDEKKIKVIMEAIDAVKGEFSKRIDAIVDFKSGKKGFYDEYAIQLELYRQMWNEYYIEHPITRIFNLAPKDWLRTVKKVPSYTFEEQTENKVLLRIPYLLELYKLMEQETKTITMMSGVIALDEKEETSNVAIYSLEELVKKHSKKEGEPVEEAENPLDKMFEGSTPKDLNEMFNGIYRN